MHSLFASRTALLLLATAGASLVWPSDAHAMSALQSPEALSFTAGTHTLPSGESAEAAWIGEVRANTGGVRRPEILVATMTAATARVRYIQAAGANWSLATINTFPFFPSVSASERIADVVSAKLGSSGPYQDVAAAYEGGGRVRIKISPFSATPALQTFGWTGAKPFRLAMIDLERDGDLDIAVLSRSAPHVRFLRNNGGIFSNVPTTITLPSSQTPTAFVVGDFNNDGAADLMIVRADARIHLYRNTTPIAATTITPFAMASTFATANRRRMDICAGDLNGDAYYDAATPVMYHPTNIEGATVFPNGGPPAYTMGQVPQNIQTLKGFWAIGSGDFDCDGDLDLVTSNVGNNRAYFGENNGSGAFNWTSTTPIGLGVFPHDIEVGDLDGDLHADIVVANRGSGTGTITRLRNNQCNKAFRHVYVGGIRDNFVANPPNGTEHACPRGAFKTWLGSAAGTFDASLCNRKVGHTFPQTGQLFPQGIAAATLTITFKKSCFGFQNDTIGLQFLPGPNRFAWTRRLKTLAPSYTGGTTTIQLDLGSLPGGYDLIPKLSQDRYLDVYIQDDTNVDSIHLDLYTCECQCGKRIGLKLGGAPWAATKTVVLTAYDVPTNNFVFFFISPQAGLLGGSIFCIKPQLFYLAFSQANSNGVATTSFTLPSFSPPPCATLATQAIAWPSFYTSNTWTAQLFL